jgi:hypothetical protein
MNGQTIVDRPYARSAAENLRRWQQSGGPRQWVEARGGRWTHADWLGLLEALRRSPYWPLEADAVGLALEESRRRREGLRRWERSGEARRWVADHGGEWTHEQWLGLLADLSRSPYWPLDLNAVATVLAEIRQEWRNLRRWQQSCQAGEWVAAREGCWGPEDRPALQEFLRREGFWPLDLEEAEAVLAQRTAQWWNLRRWQEAGQPDLWVEARQGSWGHADWLALLAGLRVSAYWPMDPDAVGAVLEQARLRYQDLHRDEEAGEEAPASWEVRVQASAPPGLMPRPTGHLGLLRLLPTPQHLDSPAA